MVGPGVDESELLELTRRLVECNTVNPPGDEATAVSVLRARLEESPVPFEIDVSEVHPNRPNLVARAGDLARGHLLLTGHMDTVPAAAEEWTGDPFSIRRDGDRIVGRGVSDMKAALAAKVVAAESYLAESSDPGAVTLAFVVDEERTGDGTAALVDAGIEADGAILGEPTNLDVGVAQKGAARYTLTVQGRGAHSGRPDSGVNAARKLWRVLRRLEAFDAEMREWTHDLLEPGSTVTVTEVAAGTAMNVVPAEATLTVDWRTVPGMPTDPEWYDRQLADALDDLSMDGEPIAVDVDRWDYFPAVEVESDAAVVEAVRDAARDEGLSGDLVGFNAGTDARFLVFGAGVPTVLFGPGDVENDAHTADESIRVDDLVLTARTYRRAIERFFE